MQNQISVIIACRNTFLCEVLREALQSRQYNVKAYATTGEDALKAIIVHQPNIVIISNDLSNVSSIEVMNNVRKKGVECKYLLISKNADEVQLLQPNSEVCGHIHSWVNMSEFFYCLQEIASGRNYTSNIIEKFINEVRSDGESFRFYPTVLKSLTPREKEIMQALSKSYTTPKIAALFFISTATVNNHRAKIMEKLNIRGRNQLLSLAFSLRPHYA